MSVDVGYRPNSDKLFANVLNFENAKKIACGLVLGFLIYHGVLHVRYGSDSCTWLLSSGRYKGNHEWQPYGCMMHRYSQTDVRHCLRYSAFLGKYNDFAFIGDSRVQQLYEHFISLARPRSSIETMAQNKKQMGNYSYFDGKLKLSIEFVASSYVSKTMVEQFRSWAKRPKPPSFIVAGAGLEIIKDLNATQKALNDYKNNITLLVQSIDSLDKAGTSVLWKLIEPVDSVKLRRDYKAISNADIDAYNRAAIEILRHSVAKIWNGPSLMSESFISSDGGLSLPDIVLKHSSQVLLNMYCNNPLNFNDGTCCADPEEYTTLQIITFSIFLVCIILATAKPFWSLTEHCHQRSNGYSLINTLNQYPKQGEISPVNSLAKLGLIMAYFYLCDRTNYFMKENKYYSEWSFWLPVGYVFALGLFFTEDSRSTRVLHREQTSEWKGWMQLVILIYHFTGASKILPIYMLVRALVSSYIFLTGYGHLCYIWQTGDTSLVRYFRVIFRLNFITVVLCLTMNRPYQFYSFVPLVSFWFTLMFVIFALPPHISPANTHNCETKPYQYLYIVVKILGLMLIVTVLYISEVFFQKIFVTRPWKALFVNSDDDIHSWWMMWKQDRYSLTFGVIFAVAYLLAQRYNWLDDSNHGNIFPTGISLTFCLAAIIGLGSYTTFTFLCKNIFDCDEIHSYVAFIPIVSYIILRNVSGVFRTKHSSLFAWFGNISLELFVSQTHIWLAADTHGVLVLIPGAPVLNLIVTSFIFVCAAHELHNLTNIVSSYAVPDDCKALIRNFVIFLAVLVPIGIKDGMF